jgi:hypothetical protein
LLSIVLVLTISGGVTDLASATGPLLLFSFMVVNTALVVLKLRPGEPAGAFEVPVFVPALGILVNAALIVARVTEAEQGYRAPAIAGLVVLGVTMLYFLARPDRVTEEVLASAEAEA